MVIFNCYGYINYGNTTISNRGMVYIKLLGGFLSHGGTPKSFRFNRNFHYTPSIFWYLPRAQDDDDLARAVALSLGENPEASGPVSPPCLGR